YIYSPADVYVICHKTCDRGAAVVFCVCSDLIGSRCTHGTHTHTHTYGHTQSDTHTQIHTNISRLCEITSFLLKALFLHFSRVFITFITFITFTPLIPFIPFIPCIMYCSCCLLLLILCKAL